MDPAACPRPRCIAGETARGRRECARLLASAKNPARPRARDLHPVLDGGESRDPTGLSAEFPKPQGDQAAPCRQREIRTRRTVAERTGRHHHATDRGQVGCRTGRGGTAAREPVRLPGRCEAAVARAAKGIARQTGAEHPGCLPSQRRQAPPEPQSRRAALSNVSPHDDAPTSPRPVSGVAMPRRPRVGAGERGQLRPAVAGRRLLHAAPGRTHGDGPERGARAAGEPVQGIVRRRELPCVHTDTGVGHRHRPARLGADAQRASTAGELLATCREGRAPPPDGRGHHLLPACFP